MPYQNHLTYLRRCIEISRQSGTAGNLPFGALLMDPSGSIIMEQQNIELTSRRCTGHAETTLADMASQVYDKDFLWNCTLYTTTEPCLMCTGAIYLANIGRIVFGITEQRLLELAGNRVRYPVFDLPCREILQRGQKKTVVLGPFPEIENETLKACRDFWK